MSNAPARSDASRQSDAIPMTTKIANLVISVVLIAIAASAIATTADFPKSMLATDVGAARFPIIHAGALILLSLILIANTLRAPTAAAEGGPPVGVAGYAGVALGMLATAGCIAAMEYVGYGPATAVYMAVIMALMGQRSPLWNPVLAVGVTGLIYAVFHYALLVPLPVGSLFE